MTFPSEIPTWGTFDEVTPGHIRVTWPEAKKDFVNRLSPASAGFKFKVYPGRPIRVTNKKSGQVYEFDSVRLAVDELGIKESTLRNLAQGKIMKTERVEWTCEYTGPVNKKQKEIT